MAVDPRDDEAERVFLAWADARESGQPEAVEDLLARHPRLAEKLAILVTDYEASLHGDLPRGQEIPTRPELHPGSEVQGSIGPYLILDRVARGGGGTLYRARHALHAHVVALKVVRKAELFDPRDLDRFREESKLLRELGIVGVVPVLETGETEDLAWMALKWIEGENLSAFAKRRPARLGGTELRQRLDLAVRLARIFAGVHAVGILHRDIKPSNVLIDRVMDPLVIDFGISRGPAALGLTGPLDAVMGTPRYLAPEVVGEGNARIGLASEVYGLGLTLYELFTGRAAYDQKDTATLFPAMRHGTAPALRSIDRELPRDLEAVIHRAIHPDPKARHPSMEALASDLDAVLQGRPIAHDTARIGGPWGRLRRAAFARRHALMALAFGLCVGGSTFLFQAVQDARWREYEAVLARFAFIPPELVPAASEAVQAAFHAVGEDPSRASFELRQDLAWWRFAEGEHEAALAMLGPVSQGEPAATARLRSWLALHLDRFAEESHALAVFERGGEPNDAAAHAVGQLSAALSLDPAERRWALRRLPPPFEALRRHQAGLAPSAGDARAALMDLVMLANGIPSMDRGPSAKARLQSLQELARALPAQASMPRGQAFARWVVAMAALEVEGPVAARADLEQCAAELADLPLSRLALGIARAAVSESQGLARADFDQARLAFERTRDVREPASAASLAFTPYQRLYIRGALLELAVGDAELARAWVKAATARFAREPERGWPFEVLLGVVEARVLAAEGEPLRAFERLEALAAFDPTAALIPREAERLAVELGRPLEEVQRYRERERAASRKRPAAIEDILASKFHGLRPFAREVFFQAVREDGR